MDALESETGGGAEWVAEEDPVGRYVTAPDTNTGKAVS